MTGVEREKHLKDTLGKVSDGDEEVAPLVVPSTKRKVRKGHSLYRSDRRQVLVSMSIPQVSIASQDNPADPTGPSVWSHSFIFLGSLRAGF